jgi:MFS family permease
MYAGLIWGIASLFYLYEYVLRVAPSVMVNDLMTHFAIGAAAFGVLSAFYLYAYAPMQLVVGVLLDRYGGRVTMTAAAACCAAGTLIFALADVYWLAIIGRTMMGIGSAFAFVGALYVATNWFKPKHFAVLSGATTTLGMLGGVSLTPLTVIVKHDGWRPTLIGVAVLGVLLTVALWIFVPKRPPWIESPEEAMADEVKTSKIPPVFLYLGRVLRNRGTWINGLFAGCIYVPTSAFAALWGIPYFKQAHGLTKEVAATVASSVFIGWVVGGPVAGWWSDQIKRRRPPLLLGAGGVLVTLLVLLYVPGLHVWQLYLLMLLMGFFSSGQVVCFAVGHELNPAPAKGSALAVTNMLCMVTGAALQPLIGLILDTRWSGKMEDGDRFFGPADYQVALTVLPILVALSLVLAFFIPETRAKAPKD